MQDRPLPAPGRPGQDQRPLGIYGVSLHGTPPKGQKTPPEGASWGWGQNALGYRLDLLRQAQRLLNDKDADMKGQHATVWCYRSFRGEDGKVNIWKHDNKARLAGLITCGMVWTCPVCAAKIAEARRLELQLAVRNWVGEGGHVNLMTLTFPHVESDSLESLVARQADALQRFKNSRRFRALLGGKGDANRYKRIGSVRGLEVTFGVNGGHPHTHDLIFCAPGLEQDKAAVRSLKCAWMRACLKVGLLKPNGRSLKPFRDFWRHGFDLSGGLRAAEYIAKYGRDERWGITSEMTRNYKKIGMARAMWADDLHVTPFQLLEWAKNGDAGAGATFRRYAKVFEGKRALSWSPGLKSRLGVRDATDEDLAGAAAPMPEETKIGALDLDQFRTVLAHDAVGDLVRYASQYAASQADLDEFVNALSRLPEVGRGLMRVGVATRPIDWNDRRPVQYSRSEGMLYG